MVMEIGEIIISDENEAIGDKKWFDRCQNSEAIADKKVIQ